jgi:hypothetical protein
MILHFNSIGLVKEVVFQKGGADSMWGLFLTHREHRCYSMRLCVYIFTTEYAEFCTEPHRARPINKLLSLPLCLVASVPFFTTEYSEFCTELHRASLIDSMPSCLNA